jgi:hypothetical protein
MKMVSVLLFGLFLYASEAKAQTCTVSFSDDFGLSLVDSSMAYGFLAPGGGLVWYYNECGAGSGNWLYLDEDPEGGYPAGVEYGHFHIPFADPAINCFTTTAAYPAGIMGRQASSGSPCVAVNPLTEPRTLYPHRRPGVLRVRYLAHSGDPLRYLIPNRIRVLGSQAVSVLFQASDGSWWSWKNLTAGTWNLGGGFPARRVYVLSSVGGDAPPWQIADLRIALGDYYTPPPVVMSLCLMCINTHATAMGDFLTTLAPRQRKAPQFASAAEVPGSDASMLADAEQAITARRISEQEALSMLRRTADPHHGHHDVDMDEIVGRILGAQGTERQFAITEYLLAVSKLPQANQPAARRRLLDLFESKRKQ